ncbi:MAG TPA: hypothetical protein VGW38_03815 [Chloroflexota bacterium]|nr:hypothetical protein [Chloroflexota bacterium]
MAKKGQHNNDQHDYDKSKGPNKPDKSVTIVTGTPKKHETYQEQARQNKDTGKQAQAAKNEWNPDTRDKPTIAGSSRARKGSLTASDERKFYAPGGDRQSHDPEYPGFSETPAGPVLPGEQHPPEWRADLNPNALAGQNFGPATDRDQKLARTAYDVKDVHNRLSGFRDDMLKQIPVLEPGTRLQQGATYIDLNDPAAREFTGMGDMEVRPGSYIVPKSEVDYQLWNMLIGVENPERIGQASEV